MSFADPQIYLDYNATAPVRPEVTEALGPMLSEFFGNPSAPYALGQQARGVLDAAREHVAHLAGCNPDCIVFTSGGTEASNLALRGAFSHAAGQGRSHMVVSAVEHPCVWETAAWLHSRGADLTVVPVDRLGRVDPDAVAAAIRPDTLLVSLMHANNETGVVQPVEQVARLCRRRGVLFHVDGVQAVGKIAVSVEDVGCDFYGLSAHKFGGLKGAGALVVRDRSVLEWIQQGGHQEGGLRAGTENVPGIFAMGKAAQIAHRDLETNQAANLAVRDVFDRLAQRIPMARINGHRAARLPNTVSICLLHADAMSVSLALSVEGIYVGTGSACASHSKKPSRVLTAMGLSDTAAHCTVRLSWGPDLGLGVAHRAAERVRETVEKIKLVTAPEDVGGCDEDCSCFVTGPPAAAQSAAKRVAR